MSDATPPQSENLSLGAMLGLAPERSLAVGQVIDDRFEILGELGRGGFGVVYRARQINVDREVALKMLRPPSGDGQKATRRFEREMMATAKLEHTHIVRLYDVGTTADGTPYMTMQLLAGESLSSLLNKGPLSWQRACAIGVQLAGALQFAHDEGIIHRDLKPSNVMVKLGADQSEVVTVLDFGLAAYAEGDPSDNKLTQTGAMLGTPTYCAPEQARGEFDHRADLYALGVMLYEMLAGRPPFEAPTAIALMYMHAKEVAEPLTSMPELKAVPAAIFEVVNALLAKSPSDRTQDAKTVRALLSAALAPPAVVPAASLPPAVVVHDGHERRWWMVGLSVAALVAVGFAVTGGSDDTEVVAGAAQEEAGPASELVVVGDKVSPTERSAVLDESSPVRASPASNTPSVTSSKGFQSVDRLTVLALSIAPRLSNKEPADVGPTLVPSRRIYCHIALNARRSARVELVWSFQGVEKQRYGVKVRPGPRFRTWAKFKGKVPGTYRCDAYVEGRHIAGESVAVAPR